MATQNSISRKIVRKSKDFFMKTFRYFRGQEKSIFKEISPSGELQGFLDSPNIQENNIGKLLVFGWVFSKGSKIKSLTLVRDDLPEEQIEYGVYSPHISEVFSDQIDAGSSGFKWSIILDSKYSGKVDIKIWATLENSERICCFARRIQVISSMPSKFNKIKKLYSFLITAGTKGLTAYQQGRLPRSPYLWIHYLHRYYRKTQNTLNANIEYSDIVHPWQKEDVYQRWLQTNILTPELFARMQEDARKLEPTGVKISIVVPVYNTPEKFLQEMIDSVKSQIYTNWELCLADDASSKPDVKEVLKQLMTEESRAKVVFRENNGHIAEASNSALEICTGEYVALLDHDDMLSPDALLQVAECISKHPEVDWIYTDEDKINETGYHFDPQMKGAWSPEMAITHNFTHHLTVIRKTLIEQVGLMRKGYEGAQDIDLFLRVSEKTTSDRIKHIPHICYHWRTHPESTASRGTQKQYVFDSAYRAIEDAIQRRGLKAKAFLPKIAQQHGLCLHQLKWDASLLAKNPVTIVIPTKDRVDLLKKCVSSLKRTVDQRFVKLLIVDDCSTESATHEYLNKLEQDKVLRCRVIHPERKSDSFNYAHLMNEAINHIDTPYVLHLNNDVQAMESGWLEDMVGWMSIDGVGVVGAKLLYPDGTIQHAGVVVGPHNGLADHLFHQLHKDEVGYICLPHAARNVSAVTGACLLTSTNLYKEIGGFDEENFAVEYNDVDYCLRVIQLDKRIVYTPQATLIHETSASRGNIYNPKEHINFIQKYRKFTDKYFNKKLNIDSTYMAVNPYNFNHIDRISTLKILIITHNLNLEGAPLIIYNHARYLAQEGRCEVSVISPQDGVLRHEYEHLNIPVKIVPQTFPSMTESIDQFRSRLKQLGDSLNIETFDLVVCNTVISFWGVELAKIFKLPAIWHIHESQSIDSIINNFFGNSSEKVMQNLLTHCFLSANRVVFTADATRRVFHKFDIHGNFRTIPDGLDLESIKQFRDSYSRSELRDKYGINRNHVVISIIGTTCQRKGQHIFIQALKELGKFGVHSNITCLIVGAREDSYHELLKNQINEFSLNNVYIYKETKDVYDFYGLSDIFVCASFEESFPRVLLEAMAFELRIVSTDVFGIPEIVNDQCEAYLVAPGNPKALANAIHKCLQEPDFSSRLASNAYAKVYRKFNSQNIIPKHLSLAKEVVLAQE